MERMGKHDQETIRRLLKAAINRLSAESQDDKEGSDSILFSENEPNAPVILVFAGGLNVQDEDAPSGLVAAPTGRRETERSSASSLDQTQGSPGAHPGLERFPLGVTDSLPAAPKACFMEPGRTCVSSGACEMRGF
jgi:hypothetical protein